MRKKLQLMPEVLPEPRRAPVRTPAGAVRARTIAHMQKLLAAAAAGSTLAGCTREGSLQDDRRPGTSGSAIATAPSGAHLDLPDAGDGTGLPPVPPPSTATTGYAVVDPVPPPAACPGLAREIAAHARWKSAGDVEITLPSAASDTVDYPVATSGISVYGGTLSGIVGGGSSQRLLVAPTPGATSVSVSLAITCNARPATLSLALDVSGARASGRAVPLTVSSY